MALKVNLKKYLKIEGRWQFVAVLRVNGLPKPAYVVLNGEPVKETAGELYLDWRSEARRHEEISLRPIDPFRKTIIARDFMHCNHPSLG